MGLDESSSVELWQTGKLLDGQFLHSLSNQRYTYSHLPRRNLFLYPLYGTLKKEESWVDVNSS